VADQSVEIPNRAAFKASEVCEIAQIPPYVLRSWEKEFPGLGAAARPGGPRIYRRSDVEQILRIKQLVFAEGLTLAGARRRLEGDPPPEELVEDVTALGTAVSDDVRSRVAQAKQELRALLDLLSSPHGVAPQSATKATTRVVPSAAAAGSEGLPLLDGVLDTPPKVRRGRRIGKEERDGAATKVE
jgi:DNA-binding transcriptional MerR regulator